MQRVGTTRGVKLAIEMAVDCKACGYRRTMHTHLACCPAPLPRLLSQSRILTPLNCSYWRDPKMQPHHVQHSYRACLPEVYQMHIPPYSGHAAVVLSTVLANEKFLYSYMS